MSTGRDGCGHPVPVSGGDVVNTLTPYFESSDVTIYQADSRVAWKLLPEHSVDAIVTSPPYFGLRDYGVDGQIGLEPSPDEYVNDLADLLTGYGERVLKPGGSLWLNLGDSYSSTQANNGGYSDKSTLAGFTSPDTKGRRANDATTPRRIAPGFPSKCLLMIPERVALALIGRGWILRNRVVWAKPNGMPSSVTDRLATKHEALFHLVRQPRYFYDLDAIRVEHVAPLHAPGNKNSVALTNHFDEPDRVWGNEAGKNPGDVWSIPTQPYPEAHFAVFPPELVRRPILATVPEGGTVLDPFFGSGTTALMARRLGRKAVGVELSEDYCRLAASRFRQDVLDFGGDAA
jgi:DNA modification methylase